jgi:hypothetical protein
VLRSFVFHKLLLFHSSKIPLCLYCDVTAFGVPSVVHADRITYENQCLQPTEHWCHSEGLRQPSVGVLGLLNPCHHEVIGVDLLQPVSGIADRVAEVLQMAGNGDCEWSRLRTAAKAKALSWQQADAAAQLVKLLRSVGRVR